MVLNLNPLSGWFDNSWSTWSNPADQTLVDLTYNNIPSTSSSLMNWLNNFNGQLQGVHTNYYAYLPEQKTPSLSDSIAPTFQFQQSNIPDFSHPSSFENNFSEYLNSIFNIYAQSSPYLYSLFGGTSTSQPIRPNSLPQDNRNVPPNNPFGNNRNTTTQHPPSLNAIGFSKDGTLQKPDGSSTQLEANDGDRFVLFEEDDIRFEVTTSRWNLGTNDPRMTVRDASLEIGDDTIEISTRHGQNGTFSLTLNGQSITGREGESITLENGAQLKWENNTLTIQTDEKTITLRDEYYYLNGSVTPRNSRKAGNASTDSIDTSSSTFKNALKSLEVEANDLENRLREIGEHQSNSKLKAELREIEDSIDMEAEDVFENMTQADGTFMDAADHALDVLGNAKNRLREMKNNGQISQEDWDDLKTRINKVSDFIQEARGNNTQATDSETVADKSSTEKSAHQIATTDLDNAAYELKERLLEVRENVTDQNVQNQLKTLATKLKTAYDRIKFETNSTNDPLFEQSIDEFQSAIAEVNSMMNKDEISAEDRNILKNAVKSLESEMSEITGNTQPTSHQAAVEDINNTSRGVENALIDLGNAQSDGATKQQFLNLAENIDSIIDKLFYASEAGNDENFMSDSQEALNIIDTVSDKLGQMHVDGNLSDEEHNNIIQKLNTLENRIRTTRQNNN